MDPNERAPLAHRLGGAALFLVAAIMGISVLRACRSDNQPLPPPIQEPVKSLVPDR